MAHIKFPDETNAGGYGFGVAPGSRGESEGWSWATLTLNESRAIRKKSLICNCVFLQCKNGVLIVQLDLICNEYLYICQAISKIPQTFHICIFTESLILQT